MKWSATLPVSADPQVQACGSSPSELRDAGGGQRSTRLPARQGTSSRT